MSESLPVIMPQIPDQRWSCRSCAYCCRELVVHLFEEDRRRLRKQGWAARLDLDPAIRVRGQWVLNKTPGGACVFLDSNNKCLIHAEFGEKAKPLACRMFPFSVRAVQDRRQGTVRFDCPSVAGSHGSPIERQALALGHLADELPAGLLEPGDAAELSAGRPAQAWEEHALIGNLVRWLRNEEFHFERRLLGATRMTTVLARAGLSTLDTEAFVELVGLLAAELPVESAKGVDHPSAPQRAMFRQLVFAHTESVTLEDLQAGILSGWLKRAGQLNRARAFRRGRGIVPAIRGFCGTTTFERVEEVAMRSESGEAVWNLLLRYIMNRIVGDSVFGGGYYGWPVFSGLSALWLSVAVIGYLSRILCAAEGRDTVSVDDVARSVGMVDRAATRLPALGTMAERARIAYLLEDEGIARLLYRYTFVDNEP